MILVSCVVAACIPAGLVGAASLYLAHHPWTVPVDWRPPASGDQGGLSIRYLGVSTYQVSDGTTTLLLDATVTRPTVWQLVTAPVASDSSVVEQWVDHADFVLVDHAHYDHLLDAPTIARMTGAEIIGSQSVCNFAIARGVPADRVRRVTAGDEMRLGTFDVRVQSTGHSPLFGSDDVMRGEIPSDAGPLRFWQMRQDATLIYRLQSGDASLLFHPSSVYTPHADLEPVDVLIFGVSGVGLDADKATQVIAAFSPAWFLPTHYDNFFQPLERGLALLPLDDLEGARAAVKRADPTLPWYVLDYGQTVRYRKGIGTAPAF